MLARIRRAQEGLKTRALQKLAPTSKTTDVSLIPGLNT